MNPVNPTPCNLVAKSSRAAFGRTKLQLQQLESRDVPSAGAFEDLASLPEFTDGSAVLPEQLTAHLNSVIGAPLRAQVRERFAVSTGPGARGQVNVYDAPTNALIGILTPYGPDANFGIRVAIGDVTGDGIQDIITAPAGGHAPIVQVFDGATLELVRSFTAYEESFTGGVFLATGDIFGTGRADIVTGAGVTGGPRVRVFAANDIAPQGETRLTVEPFSRRDFFGYEAEFRGGVSVAVADVDADGYADLILGAGPGGGPRIVVISGKDDTQLANFFAYDSSLRSGISVSGGRIQPFGPASFVTVPMSGVNSDVKIFQVNHGETPVASWNLNEHDFKANGVAVRDLTGDGRSDLILVSAPNTPPRVIVLDAESGARLRDFPGFMPEYLGGLFVA